MWLAREKICRPIGLEAGHDDAQKTAVESRRRVLQAKKTGHRQWVVVWC